jgi:hypothetical protein
MMPPLCQSLPFRFRYKTVGSEVLSVVSDFSVVVPSSGGSFVSEEHIASIFKKYKPIKNQQKRVAIVKIEALCSS